MKKQITKVLIANRGEIALRVLRACRELNLSTVAVYSTADAEALHVKFADESVCIGPPAATDSYLNMHALLSAAEITGADAVHPGYGFLSENAAFARACESMGLLFIGPSGDIIESMGNKVKAKEAVERMGVPLLPSMKLTAQNAALSETQILEEAKKIGYPVLIKAAMGGGGRGMKIVRKADDLIAALNLARQESRSAFGSEEVYIEKYCEEPRHIEIQVMGDRYGNLRHFGERDCSIQRRHQKLLEEALSPALSPELRAAIGEAGLKAAAAVNYFTAGTVEFLLDTDQRFYFLEMNTRIQVEHPVTEMVTGFDLVREQIKTAIGEKISYSQNEIQFKGHAIECRITAEDPSTFAPSPGRIELFHPPYGRGVRLESCAHTDFFVPPYYDSMIGKLITYDENREFCIRRMKQALKEFVVRGIKTTIPLHLAILEDADFIAGRYTTKFLQTFKPQF